MHFPLEEDIELVQELLCVDSRSLSDSLGISRMTLNRWSKHPEQASRQKLEAFYGYAFSQGIHLNEIHAQLFIEEARSRGLVPLFHGSKRGIDGPLAIGASRADNDFGQGFYCGESFRQSAMFVANYPEAVAYEVAFDPRGLVEQAFAVDRNWMLAVALFRGKLAEYSGHPALESIAALVAAADFVRAPIADNRMFRIIDSFIDGEITDVQCERSLSATSLGFQYVMKSHRALDHIVRIEPHYLCGPEKSHYLSQQQEHTKTGIDKSKAARRMYRNQGMYIEEVLS